MNKINFHQLKKLLPGLKRNVLLKNYTTFKIGGPAKYFFVAKNTEDLIKAVLVAKKLKLPFFVLGGGSNLLVSDKGYNGLVIKVQGSRFKVQGSTITTEAGVPLGKLVRVLIEKGLSGLEWAAGIPGTVGGAIFGNAGAFGSLMRDVVKKVEVFDIKNEKIKIFQNKNCKFNYRESVFKKNKNLIILSAVIQLKKGRHPPATRKKEIKNKIKENLKSRKEKQPLNFPSAGSVFKNPSPAQVLKKFGRASGFLAGRLKRGEPRSFGAGELIEKCGLKGKRIGNVKISEKHANFIVNLGGAKAKDVKKLINLVKKEVKNKFRIVLKEEIIILS